MRAYTHIVRADQCLKSAQRFYLNNISENIELPLLFCICLFLVIWSLFIACINFARAHNWPLSSVGPPALTAIELRNNLEIRRRMCRNYRIECWIMPCYTYLPAYAMCVRSQIAIVFSKHAIRWNCLHCVCLPLPYVRVNGLVYVRYNF